MSIPGQHSVNPWAGQPEPGHAQPGQPVGHKATPAVWQPQPSPYAHPAQYAPVPYTAPQAAPGYGPTYVVPMKESGTAYLLWFFLGHFGAHHFYIGRTGWGIAMLLCWLFGWMTVWLFVGALPLLFVVIMWFVDLFMIPSYVREANARLGVPRGF